MIKKIEMKFYSFVWIVAEFFDIKLGKTAPFIFGKMIGIKGERVD